MNKLDIALLLKFESAIIVCIFVLNLNMEIG